MRKKTPQFLLLVLGPLLLLVVATASAQAQDFTGTWNTVTGQGETIVLTLRQTGTEVRGGYSALRGLTGGSDLRVEGSLKGNVKGNTLLFTWRQEDGKQGAGRFAISSDGQSFDGTISATKNPDDTSGGTWNGTRKHSFAGAWRGKLGEGALESILQQADNRVTGQLRVNSAELGMIKDGVVVGNTLRFKVVRAGRVLSNGSSLPDEYVGVGELVMDGGGKSFSGTILGAKASGNLLGR